MRNSIPWPDRADRRPLCIAHRGASAHAVENTLAAFRTAAELGADMWEIDVQLTRDGVPVVSHDAALTRIFGVEGQIAALDFDEIRARAPDLPMLREVVELAESLGQALYVEVKADGAGLIAADLLEDMKFTRAGFGSFKVAEIAAMAAANCPYPLAALIPLDSDPFERAEQSGADIIHLCWERGGERPQDLVTPDLIAEAERRGLGLVLWHEERKSVLTDLLTLPVLGICTNQPELMAGADSLDMRGIGMVAHRGANHFAPENTLAAARLSFDQGAAYVEIDVRESADGEIVVIHDATLERTTNGRGLVTEHSLANLKALDAGGWHSPVHRGETIPTLGEMITLARGYGAKLYIENKSVAPEKLVAAVEALDFLDDCFFWSADPALLAGMRAASPRARIKAGLNDPETLAPAIIEMEMEDYLIHAPAVAARGVVPMLQYFGDDPAMFEKVVAIRPALINLDRADLLLASLRCSATH